MQALQGTCTLSRACSSSAMCFSSLLRNPPCRRLAAKPSWWVSLCKSGWTAALRCSGSRATCVPRRLPLAQFWDFVLKPLGAPCLQTPSLNWAQSNMMDGSGSPSRGEKLSAGHSETDRGRAGPVQENSRRTCANWLPSYRLAHDLRAHKQDFPTQRSSL